MTLVEFSLVEGEVAGIKCKDRFAGRIPIEIQAT